MASTPRRADWLMRWAADTPVQVGIAAASWSIAGSLARGLLPRSPIQQAVSTGVIGAAHYQLGATTWAFLQAAAALPGQRPGVRANLVVAGTSIAAGVGVMAATNHRSAASLPAAVAAAAGRVTAFSGLAGGAAALWNDVLERRLGLRPGLDTTLLPAVATGAGVVAFSVLNRSRRAARYGIVAPDRHAVTRTTLATSMQAGAIGLVSGVGFAALTTGEQLAARGVEHAIAKLTRTNPGALGALVAHSVILGSMAAAGVVALNEVTRRAERRDDIVEPAYPTPPTSPHVSAGPASSMPFDALGKEGRRFVLMALTPEEITEVMGEPAMAPVRVVGGYEAAADLHERARLTVQDMEDCGAFDRQVICIGVPTGVGYFNYSFAEALEYLTLGDCAIVVPQYALVPSALALDKTSAGEQLTRHIVVAVAERLAKTGSSARLLLAGESLGANIALDIARDPQGRSSIDVLDTLGIESGLYLGVPFRTRLWRAWQDDPTAVDPTGRLLLVSQPDEASTITPGQSRHLMIVHNDDPVNKYGYRMVLQPPWWMGPPASRPPLIPRETKFRPITTFVLSTVDLLNGMHSRPGEFVRRGHDYRIDLRLGIERAFGLTSTDAQAEAIESALRMRERTWATKRMVARKLDRARRAIEQQLTQWGQGGIDVADLDPEAEELLAAMRPLDALTRLGSSSHA